MNETQSSQHKMSTAGSRPAAAPPAGARPGSFWERWKEWERANGTVPAPVRESAA